MAVDILMAISDSAGNWVAGASQAVLTAEQSGGGLAKDLLAQDLYAGKIFDITDFHLGVGLEQGETDDGMDKLIGAAKDSDDPNLKALAKKLGKGKTGTRKYEDWIKNNDAWRERSRGGNGYPLDFQAFSFTRQVDQSSTYLFDMCVHATTLRKAAVLKRKSGGAALGGVYLRLDFRDVLITDIDWDVDESVKEKVKFICRAVAARYRAQTNTGALDSTVLRAKWDPLRKLAAI